MTQDKSIKNPSPEKKEKVLYPDIPQDTIADSPVSVPDPTSLALVWTPIEMEKEIQRIEFLNYTNEKKLKTFKSQLEMIQSTIEILEKVIPANESVIDYIRSRINILKPKTIKK